MPNWCSTTFVFHGDGEEIETLYKFIDHAIDQNRTDNSTSDFKAAWLGNILLDLGIDKEDVCHGDDPHYRCRGWIEDVMFDEIGDDIYELRRYGDDTYELRLYTETAWDVMDEMWELTIEKLGLKSIKFSFCAEEEGCGYYVKHNAEGYNDFQEKYRLDTYIEKEIDGKMYQGELVEPYCERESEVVDELNKIFGTEHSKLEDFDDLIDKFNDKNEGDQWIYVHKFEEV